jgi:hypothetical protein
LTFLLGEVLRQVRRNQVFLSNRKGESHER